jgi:toxin ParE1/3/4
VIVAWTPQAVGDVAAIHRYVSRFNPSAAAHLAQSLYGVGESLSAFPERGRPGLIEGTRELVVFGAYVVVYRIRAEMVEIVRVWHAAQQR